MALTNTSYLVLGMLHTGAKSGYDIKRMVELSARFFWKISPVQIYPELQRLEEKGLITGHDDLQSPRRRRSYELTDLGLTSLRNWLTGNDKMPIELRDIGLLKLFFADAIEPEQAISHVRALRERSEAMAERLHSQIQPAAAEAQEAEGVEFPARAARLGIEYHEWLVEWYGRLESELEAEL